MREPRCHLDQSFAGTFSPNRTRNRSRVAYISRVTRQQIEKYLYLSKLSAMRQCFLMKVSSCSTWVVHIRFSSYPCAHGSALEQVCLGIDSAFPTNSKRPPRDVVLRERTGTLSRYRWKTVSQRPTVHAFYGFCQNLCCEGEDAYTDNLSSRSSSEWHSPSIHPNTRRRLHGINDDHSCRRDRETSSVTEVFIISGQPNPYKTLVNTNTM
ncbi:hypothetical protein EV421DRAFT_1803160 [Armillaria borealis]|uniref:Uncharacterized protein n=1 Tax=Armillaria borealis TaxID=47425 RepID=A0AA39MRW8_9AGAR|nr:hypothetical protein EV421DRAFT_1803160 [Armillaria borealis]